jgi:hypothetical protein
MRYDICLALLSCKTNMGIPMKDRTTEPTIPPIAKPLPINLPPLFSIRTRAMMPQMMAGKTVRPTKSVRIARTKDAMASPLVRTDITSGPAVGCVKMALQELHIRAF